MKTLLLVVVLAGLLIAAIAASATTWARLDGVETSPHMWIALAAGGLATAGLWGGLMALVFHSSRRGYDDIERRDGL